MIDYSSINNVKNQRKRRLLRRMMVWFKIPILENYGIQKLEK
jgi:hypothetical protein